MGLATDTTVCSSRQGEALEVEKLTFTIRASDSSWHPGLPWRPVANVPFHPLCHDVVVPVWRQRFQGVGLGIWGFGVSDFGLLVSDFWFLILDFGFRVSSFGFRVSGIG